MRKVIITCDVCGKVVQYSVPFIDFKGFVTGSIQGYILPRMEHVCYECNDVIVRDLRQAFKDTCEKLKNKQNV